jgi:hypothetical protein
MPFWLSWVKVEMVRSSFFSMFISVMASPNLKKDPPPICSMLPKMLNTQECGR